MEDSEKINLKNDQKDPPPRDSIKSRVAVVTGGSGGVIGRKLGLAMVCASLGVMASSGPMLPYPSPRLPTPRPARVLSEADAARIKAAEDKRQRRINRNRGL